jgi:hypothetical protein
MRTLRHDGIISHFEQTIIPDPAESSQIHHIEFVSDIADIKIPTSPYSIRYYTQTEPIDNVPVIQIKIQIDGGANRSITSRQDLLHRYKPTNAYPIYGVNKDDVALQCVGRGYLPWIADSGDTLYIPMFFSPEAAETIISPTDVVLSHSHIYCAWAQFSHCTTGHMSPFIALRVLTIPPTLSPCAMVYGIMTPQHQRLIKTHRMLTPQLSI